VLTIGFLGGMSWESSAGYYRLANELVRRELGGLHSAQCVLYSVDFDDIERLQSAGNWADSGRLLAEAGRRLEAAGADLLVLCTNTMHKVADEIRAGIGIPLLDILDVTAAAVLGAGISTVGLLGTRYTMTDPFFRDRLAGHGLQVLVPDARDGDVVHDVIYRELCVGIVSDASRAEYRRIMSALVAAGAQGIILGCTEIEMLVGAGDIDVPVFPTTTLHVEAAVAQALSG
jgi:aspartate racemase